MEITGKNSALPAYFQAREVERSQPGTDAKPKSATAGGAQDTVALSRSAREMHAADLYMQSIPDVRHEKVLALKQQVEAGTYHVDAKGIAVKLLQESILNQLV